VPIFLAFSCLVFSSFEIFILLQRGTHLVLKSALTLKKEQVCLHKFVSFLLHFFLLSAYSHRVQLFLWGYLPFFMWDFLINKDSHLLSHIL
jgi:hypothetical protein